jgi:hypothetical protein
MTELATRHDWAPFLRENDSAAESDVEGIRGLLYSIAISLVFVWTPIAFIFFGATLLTGR